MLTLTFTDDNDKIMEEDKFSTEVSMYSAISTACLYPIETEKSLELLLKLGFRSFEVFINSESEFSDDFISRLGMTAKRYNADICSLHLYTSGFEPFMFFSNYLRRFNDSLEMYRRYFQKAACLGAKTVIFHGDRKGSKLPLEEFCERFAILAKTAEDEGVTLAQENVSRCRSGTVAEVRNMKKMLGSRIKFALDVKQALRAGESPFEMADAMSGNIACVHLSDSTAENDCLLPGAGKYDIARFKVKLRDCSFDGALITEVYRTSFGRLEELRSTIGL